MISDNLFFFPHKYPTNVFSNVVVNLLLYCCSSVCLFVLLTAKTLISFKNQDQQQIHVGRLSTKGGNDATSLRFIDSLWKLKWFLNIGSQTRLKKSIATIDKFVYRLIITKRKEQITLEDILSRFLVEREKDPERMNDKYLRDIILSFMIAGKDTTAASLSWFLYMLCKNPLVQEKIMQYLHAALSETLRLYPAVPVDTRCAENDDVLPDGHRVKRGDNVYYISYAIGTMTYIWGQQAEEFKPERWLKDGVFQPESPFKFISFHVCWSKNLPWQRFCIPPNEDSINGTSSLLSLQNSR
ncbi:unnamed protein product [Brassica oleracea var. botrytis]|uniref:(rape) hypothetical protein n=1 Tax=Brassica napus TaxID=3708 RepID=A0A078G0U8_BRANA|nr:unnamed protein product [Brassica napus]CDY18916.1 BnaC04g04340D [Brassica napus]